MRLVEVTVKNYRSIESQTKFGVEDLTSLIGPNNEGKTNLLRALALGMFLIERWGSLPERISGQAELSGPDAAMLLRGSRGVGVSRRSDSIGYNWSDDYPLAKQERKGTHPTVLRLKFKLTDEEIRDFTQATGISNNGELPVEISLSRAAASFGVLKPGRGAAGHKAKASEIAGFIAQRLSFVLIPAVRTVEQARTLLNDLARLRIREIAKSEEYMELSRKLSDLRQIAVDGVSSELTASVRRYLPSVTDIQVVTTDFERSDTVDDVLINDGSVTSIANKGDGVKSLVTLALIQELARENAKSHSFILAVDEPEAHLHSTAVHELQVLFQDLSTDQQVILATHNPIFVNRDKIDSNVLVLANEAKPAKSIAQIRQAIGVLLHDNLDSAETVVLVEGVTDTNVLPRLLTLGDPHLTSDIQSGRVIFKATTGTGKLRQHIVREKSTVCRIIAVLDGDEAGQQEAKRLRDESLLVTGNIFLIRDTNRKFSELEDILEPRVYLESLSSELDRTFQAKHFSNRSRKWSKNLEAAAHSLGVAEEGLELVTRAKRAVAAAVAGAVAPAVKADAQENLDALKALIWPSSTPR
ncbi:hypothetical protein D9V29_09260 [Mycetocola manganoxydans]|uniref:Endonuclease GajA/Old nuclease/RecF-like AAA domain-containing protein n=2 Tax=Mycetocola manganoxydans TaxID=699879 RepID=A0A3L6ZWK7_9MICO|nr:hypothetical protein D9V29_09260 [Mycetocola manganoxydans]GHD46887.1 hypothetical protein GCM10008097_17400 [Mycetocola manganoxydans]